MSRGCVTPSLVKFILQYIQQLATTEQHDQGEYETVTASLLDKPAAKLASDLTPHWPCRVK